MRLEDAVKRGVFYSFIPKKLEMREFPEYRVFPFNVLFAHDTMRDGETIRGSALYEPEFHTYKKDGRFSSMRYHNVYGDNCHLIIAFDDENKLYCGVKFVGDKEVGRADGNANWQMFFVHLTALGLANGEKCKFDRPDETIER